MRFSRDHRLTFAAMEAVLKLFNDLRVIKDGGKITQQRVDGACLAFLARLGIDARLDDSRKLIVYTEPFCINDVGKKDEKEGREGLGAQIYEKLRGLGVEQRLDYDNRQMQVIFRLSGLLRGHVRNNAILHFGVMNVNEDSTTYVDSGGIGTQVTRDLTDIVFDIAGHPIEMMPEDDCMSEAIKQLLGTVDINELQEFLAKENAYTLRRQQEGRLSGRHRGMHQVHSGRYQEIKRHFAVQPYSELAALTINSLSNEDFQLFVPDIYSSKFKSVLHLVGTIIVNYCIYFGGTSRVKLCQQCGSFILEKRQKAKKFCDASCRLAYSNSTEQVEKRKCRDRQNKYINYQAGKMTKHILPYPVFKDDCSGCKQIEKGGQCKVLIGNNRDIISNQ